MTTLAHREQKVVQRGPKIILRTQSDTVEMEVTLVAASWEFPVGSLMVIIYTGT